MLGFLSGARCKLASGPADATATHSLASVKSRLVLPPAHPGSPGQRAVKRVCVRACVCICVHYFTDTNNSVTTLINNLENLEMSGNLAAVWGASGNWPKRGKCRAILQCLESGHPEASVRFSGHLCECVLANCTLAFPPWHSSGILHFSADFMG